MIINNTGFSSVKIFCESKTADISIHNARKIWSLETPIVLSNDNQIKMTCSVESCSIPLSYYLINQSNNKLKLNDSIYTIDEGNYSAISIIEQLNEIQLDIVFSFSKTLSKFKLSTTQVVVIDSIDNNIYDLLGIEPTTLRIGSHVCPHICNLIYTTGIYISLNNISNTNIDTATSNQSSNVLIRLPIDQPTNTYLQFFNNLGFKSIISTTVLNQIDISLLDDKRDYLELTSNVPWTVVLRIDFERTIVETSRKTKIEELRSL
jgi:hypothetical protein